MDDSISNCHGAYNFVEKTDIPTGTSVVVSKSQFSKHVFVF